MTNGSTVDLVYVDSGGGHRAAATALAQVIQEQHRPWNVRLLNIQDLFDSIDFIHKYTGIRFQDLYNIMLRRGWSFLSGPLTPLSHFLISLSHTSQVRVVAEHFTDHPPDMVVSLIPHFNRAIKDGLQRACPEVPMVTILTDIADYPPHFWLERQDQYVICGSEKAAAQARAIGLAEDHIFRASGMILHPNFYEPMHIDRKAERTRLGLEPDRPTGLVLFGGQGSMDLVKVAKALNHERTGVQLILICGRHEKATRTLRTLPRRIPMLIEGFTSSIRYYMAISDFFIGKPGPGCISEALQMRLPVIVENNYRVLAHERQNAEWIRENRVGIVIRSFSELPGAVNELLSPANYDRYRENAAALSNFAVYEIPDLLERILASAGPKHPAPLQLA